MRHNFGPHLAIGQPCDEGHACEFDVFHGLAGSCDKPKGRYHDFCSSDVIDIFFTSKHRPIVHFCMNWFGVTESVIEICLHERGEIDSLLMFLSVQSFWANATRSCTSPLNRRSILLH